MTLKDWLEDDRALQKYKKDYGLATSDKKTLRGQKEELTKKVAELTEQLETVNNELTGLKEVHNTVRLGVGQSRVGTHAAYENHHTRELSAEGADVYIASKAHDIWEDVRIWKEHFPELTDEMSHDYACLWIKKILIPNIRKSCYEKLAYYQSMHKQNNMSKSLKEEIERCINKNLRYISDIDELANRSDIRAGVRKQE